MTRSVEHQRPSGYVLRVAGHLDQHWSSWFGDLTLTREDDGTTSISGLIADQAALHGLLTRIRDLGIVLISVAPVDAPQVDLTATKGDAGPSIGPPFGG